MVGRKSIQVDTLEKVRTFLSKQKDYIYPSNIQRQTGINWDSIKKALEIIKPKTDKLGRVKI